MIEEEGIVLSTDGGTALVEAQPQSACGSCSVRKGCGTSMLAGLFKSRVGAIEASNQIGAKPGDRVVVGLREGHLQTAAFIVYAIPIITLLLGAILGEVLAARMQQENLEPFSILGGLLGVLAGMYVAKRFNQNVQGDKQFQAVILKIQTQSFAVGDLR